MSRKSRTRRRKATRVSPPHRSKSGRRVAKPKEDPRETAERARQRLFGVSEQSVQLDRGQGHLGSSLGRLYGSGLISQGQFQAGTEFAALVRKHYAIQGLPRLTVKQVNFELVGGFSTDNGAYEADDVKIKGVSDAYKRILATLGHEWHDLLMALCLRDEQPAVKDMKNIYLALELLRKHFRLTEA